MTNDDVLNRVYSYYEHFGYEITFLDTKFQPSMIKGWHFAGFYQDRRLEDEIGAGITKSDVEMFLDIKNKSSSIKNIYIIGNAFGFSTFVLATIFPDACIDVIDAEIEGDRNGCGSDLTRKIINEYGLNVNLTIGFSPKDNLISMRSKYYDLVFIDGEHTEEQIKLDLNGVKKYMREKSYIVCHDLLVFPKLWNNVLEFCDQNIEYDLYFYEGVEYENRVGSVYFVKEKNNE